MYNYSNFPGGNTQFVQGNQDERLLGGFAFPFLLGGVTGAALAPSFYGPSYRPYPYYRPNFGPYPPYRPIPRPYPYYR